MSKIEMIKTGGPFGDETCNYDVVTDAKTIGEFIKDAIKNDNFVTFTIRSSNRTIPTDDICVAYANHGDIVRKASKYDEYTKSKFTRIWANGGWGAMGYDIEVEDFNSLPKQDRKEFHMVYFGWTVKDKK